MVGPLAGGLYWMDATTPPGVLVWNQTDRLGVVSVFSWSSRHLSPAAALMFRLLGVHCGPDISAPAAGSLCGVPVSQARAALRELIQGHLITEHEPGRFALHGLVRAYAAEQASAHHNDAERRSAIQRVLDHYLHTVRETAGC